MPLLVDTHVLIWVMGDDRRIGRRARTTINRALTGDSLLLSAVSFWEVARLVRQGRLEIDSEPAAWRKGVLDGGFQEIALDGDIGIRAAGLGGLSGDPIDRFIVATALARGAAIVTADESILGWRGSLVRHDAAK
jgi:PIN domain nuclease of toxin-antitoxin system